ncbi:hypothetical protein EJ06DRAFT_310218 [Trichodelitschia bisporula]|uniref:Rhodopsin domain-containing protein n=1 Tax=Trichodelitschia bisporula TaxID=703511 RepID=A0A6G1I3Q7_9PEZI|nr:hypothetical protein EJ06DRAFT_310218 [Trichodelitschia bisporula]
MSSSSTNTKVVWDASASQGLAVNAVCITFGVLMTIVIALRFYTRVHVIRSVGHDDLLMCAAFVLAWIVIGVTMQAVKLGVGTHYWVIVAKGADVVAAYWRALWFVALAYNAAMMVIKISVLALYQRLGDRGLKRLSFGMMGIVACSGIANMLTVVFQCKPLDAAWDIRIKEKKCINLNGFYLAVAVTNILTDLMTYTLPIPLVVKLQLPKKQKIVLGIMLCLGLFACLTSMARIITVPKLLVTKDPSWTIATPTYWAIIECCVGIITASIPSLKPLAKRYIPRILGEPSGRASGNRGEHGTSEAESGDETLRKHRAHRGHSGITSRATLRSAASLNSDSDMEKEQEMVGIGHAELRTVVEQDLEAGRQTLLNVPEGKIMAITEIVTHFEER